MDYLLGFLILLCILIFIHEFGHFIVAKACGIRVETFSIGMGTKILRFTRGETEYALSILPLGGYVKLLGQDPREDVPAGLEARSFRNKPLWQRAAVVLAGPFFNAALAVAILTGLYGHGVPTASPVLARILPGSEAEKAGFRNGDLVVSIARAGESEHRVRELSELEGLIGSSTGREIHLKVRHPAEAEGGTEQEQTLAFTPVLGSERDSSTGVVRERGTIPGVEYFEAGPVVQVDAKSWGGTRQLPPFLWIEELTYSVDGVERTETPTTLAALEKTWARISTALGKTDNGKITLRGRSLDLVSAEPPENSETFQLAWTFRKDAPPVSLAKAGLHSAELCMTDIVSGTPAEKLGLQRGDCIQSLSGEPVYSLLSFRARLQTAAASGQELRLAWSRGGKPMEAAVHPQLAEIRDPLTQAKKMQFQIGAHFLAVQAPPPEIVLKGENLRDTIGLGLTKTWKLTVSMLESFWMLATGEISPKTLGGPILIGKIAGESFRAGMIPFLRTMAFISMNLCVLNLLPVPVLDGGHLLLYCIESVRRRPISSRIIEIWTTTGFFLLMGLMAVVFFNDLARLDLSHILSKFRN